MNLKKSTKINARKAPGVVGAVKNKQLFEKLYPVALKMRKDPTNAEQILWQELRAKRLGVKFRRQHLIDQFIVDFYCVELGLVVEVDGGIHKRQWSADLEREHFLKAQGCSIIRFNNKVVAEELPEVIIKIKAVIRDLSK